MKKAYMIVTHVSQDDASTCDTPHNIGVEYMGDCSGVIIDEHGTILGEHHSSNYGWLRMDLKSKVNEDDYDIIDYIGVNMPNDILDLLYKNEEIK